MSTNTGAIISVLPPNGFAWKAVWGFLKPEGEFCLHCGVLRAKDEHNWRAHQSTLEYAKELARWKREMKRTSEHHQVSK